MQLPPESVCETCPIRQVCVDEEELRFVLACISRRDQVIFNDNESIFGLTNEQVKAEAKCRQAKDKTSDCTFTTVENLTANKVE